MEGELAIAALVFSLTLAWLAHLAQRTL